MEDDETIAFVILIIVDILMIVVSICLHALGLFLMFKVKQRRKNLHTILIHLSLVEIVTQSCRFGSAVYFYIYNDNEEYLGYQVLRTLTIQGWCVTYVLVMIIIALDPLLIVTLKTSYNKYVHQKNLNIVLGVCWAFGVINGLVNFALPYLKREEIAKNFTFPIIAIVFLLSSILSYAMIYKHLQDHNNKNMARISVTSTATQKRPALKFRVPMLIVLTFFFFVAAPSAAQILVKNKLTKTVLLILGILFSIGFICDAMIYLFLHPTTKKLLYIHAICFKEKRHCVDIMETSRRITTVCSPKPASKPTSDTPKTLLRFEHQKVATPESLHRFDPGRLSVTTKF